MSQPVVVTERLELWRPARGDLAGAVALMESPETRRYLGAMQPGEVEQYERLKRHAGGWALYGYGNFYIRPRGSDQIIGNAGVFPSWRGRPGLNDVPEAGWIIHHDWVGKGVAREAMEAAIGWFESAHGRQRIGCMIEAGNVPSERLAAALGFVEYHRVEEGEGRGLVLYERL